MYQNNYFKLNSDWRIDNMRKIIDKFITNVFLFLKLKICKGER